MKLVVLLLLSNICFGQVEKYLSFSHIETEKDYTEQYYDTCKVYIQNNNRGKTIFVSGKGIFEALNIGEPFLSYTNPIGLKSIQYNTSEKLSKVIVELLYQEGKLMQVCIIRSLHISCYIINITKDSI